MITLTDLLAYEVEEVLVTPLLRQAVISYTRNLFYGGSLINSCDSSVRNYFRRLQLEGIEKQRKILNMKYRLKPNSFIVYSGQTYNSSSLTDEVAEAKIKECPEMLGSTILLTDPAPRAVKPRAKKK